MTGKAKLSTKLDLGPGEADVSNRLNLAGTFLISGAQSELALVSKERHRVL
jgi:hypothetical protein